MSGVLVKLISLMLLFPRWGLPAVQPLTSRYSFATASVQLLKFNSICHLRKKDLGKALFIKKNFFSKRVGPVKSKRKTIFFKHLSGRQSEKCELWPLCFSEARGRKSEDKHRQTDRHTDTHTHTQSFRCSWKNEVRFRRPGSKEKRFLKLLWGTLWSVLRAD